MQHSSWTESFFFFPFISSCIVAMHTPWNHSLQLLQRIIDIPLTFGILHVQYTVMVCSILRRSLDTGNILKC